MLEEGSAAMVEWWVGGGRMVGWRRGMPEASQGGPAFNPKGMTDCGRVRKRQAYLREADDEGMASELAHSSWVWRRKRKREPHGSAHPLHKEST